MKISINKEVKLLSLSFLFVFFGYNAVQQFITPFFSESGLTNVGFRALILIYLFFFLSGPFSALFVSKFGAKISMVIASLIYATFIFSLIVKNIWLVYLTSVLIGIAASLLWTGQNSYLVRASDKKSYGENSGFFNTFLAIGSALGALLLGFLVVNFGFQLPFAFYVVFPLIGILLITRLQDLRAKPKSNQLLLIKRAILSKTALKLSVFYFAFQVIFGLIIGFIPIDIKSTLSITYVGWLSSMIFIMPIILSYIFGKLSDIKGRTIMIVISYILAIAGLLLLYPSQQPILLILGIILFGISYAIFRPLSFALIGDVSNEENLEVLTALFWMAQNLGVLFALGISSLILAKTIYLASIVIMIISLLILYPLLKSDLKVIKSKIDQEIK